MWSMPSWTTQPILNCARSMYWQLGVNWDRGRGGWLMECNAFSFFFLFFCRSIKNTEQGINESCLMSTVCFYNRLVMKGCLGSFLWNKNGGVEKAGWVEVHVWRAASQEHLFVLPTNRWLSANIWDAHRCFLEPKQHSLYVLLSAGSPQPPHNNSVESSLSLTTKAKSQPFYWVQFR